MQKVSILLFKSTKNICNHIRCLVQSISNEPSPKKIRLNTSDDGNDCKNYFLKKILNV